jgi:hypothetical protein
MTPAAARARWLQQLAPPAAAAGGATDNGKDKGAHPDVARIASQQDIHQMSQHEHSAHQGMSRQVFIALDGHRGVGWGGS